MYATVGGTVLLLVVILLWRCRRRNTEKVPTCDCFFVCAVYVSSRVLVRVCAHEFMWVGVIISKSVCTSCRVRVQMNGFVCDCPYLCVCGVQCLFLVRPLCISVYANVYTRLLLRLL